MGRGGDVTDGLTFNVVMKKKEMAIQPSMS